MAEKKKAEETVTAQLERIEETMEAQLAQANMQEELARFEADLRRAPLEGALLAHLFEAQHCSAAADQSSRYADLSAREEAQGPSPHKAGPPDEDHASGHAVPAQEPPLL